MFYYILRRIAIMIPTLIAISILSFVIIQLPPGDFVTAYVTSLETQGEVVTQDRVIALRNRYGLGDPIYLQYWKWISGILRGDWGQSLQWNEPVGKLVMSRLPWSIAVSLSGLVFMYLVGIPIGAMSATHPYSIRDYFFTVIGFIGLAIPNFLFALVMLWLIFLATGRAALGLFSAEYQMAPWSIGKVLDLLNHLWVPAIIIGTAGTCRLIRIMRANLLDELQKPYVMVARSKGLPERTVLYRYPFRIAMNPVLSTIGWELPRLVNGELLVSLVIGLPTLAPIFFDALLNQDMYLAGSIVFMLSFFTVIGTLLSDLLLAWADPRIRGAI